MNNKSLIKGESKQD